MRALLDSVDTRAGLLQFYEAGPEDGQVILDMLREAAEWMVENSLRQWVPEMFTLEDILGYFDVRKVYLAVHGGQPVGMFTLQQGDPDYWQERNDDQYAYLHRLTVRKAFRGNAFSRHMLQFAERLALSQGLKGLRLDCVAHNPKLNAFYQSNGFRYMGYQDMGSRFTNLYEKNQDTDPDRIQLVYFNEHDVALLKEWSYSPEFQVQWSGTGWSFPITTEDMVAYLEDANNPVTSSRLIYSVVHVETGEKIGHISLASIVRKNKSARIGRVLIGNPSYLGRGIGQKMIEEMLRIGFDALHLHRITLGVFDFNTSAIRTYEAAGFRQEGLFREATLAGDTYWNKIEMAILRREWEDLRRPKRL
ncbi:GNAT family N-acetyltransferase [Paenibacillus sediminis]|uniref:RimJ/RimL family protein N-acetyltransferase n=1 Tax=Paenibacillus sediminis TaxID=664909 RepID=A0ABS4H0A4_9BACL|nr:GNAT family N-acetyltransferase [Paenibacillus sediminis]MBP1935944.1 RimJ/RimL family protein N-acetyltransferase [Paenibacillus sediminis]